MIKNKFIVGLGIGIVGCKFYNSFKSILNPGMVKVVQTSIAMGENTKNFFKEATQTALELNKGNYRKISEECTKENENNMPQNIENLRRQLTEMQQQLLKLKP